jgi:hypothetical protein
MEVFQNLKMQNNMEDNVFGKMEFNVGWYTTKSVDFWNKRYVLKMRTSTLFEECPNGSQKQAYLHFNADIANISSKSFDLVSEFIEDNIEEIEDVFGTPIPTDIHELIIPQQVLFFKNGKTAIICKAIWTDENVVVLISDKMQVDFGYIIENER